MKIAVAYKWAGDPQEASVGADGTVDLSRAKSVVSDYDAVAIEVGRQLADATGAELVGLCVGGAAAAVPMATKSALARGLDRVVLATDDQLATAGSTSIAAVMAELVRRLGDVSLVLTGDSSIDVGAKMVPTVLGGFLAWPTLTDVTGVTPDGSALAVSRTLAEGVQNLRVESPAVLAIATDAATPRVPGMKDVLAAGKKPVEVIPAASLAVPTVLEGVLRSAAPLEGPSRKSIRIDGSDPRAGATALVSALRSDGVLAKTTGDRA
ncbi:electron transfer flavoprotein subunit beta/FixA family protein [Tessaracoccus sp. Z1128]